MVNGQLATDEGSYFSGVTQFRIFLSNRMNSGMDEVNDVCLGRPQFKSNFFFLLPIMSYSLCLENPSL